MWCCNGSCSASARPFGVIRLSPFPHHRTILLLLHPSTLTWNCTTTRRSSSLKNQYHASSPIDRYNGWDFVQPPPFPFPFPLFPSPNNINNRDLPIFLLVGIGTSMVILLALIAQSSFSRRGLSVRLSRPLHPLHGILRLSRTEKSAEFETSANNAVYGETKDSEAYLKNVVEEVEVTMELEKKYPEKQGRKIERILIPTALDSTQQEALLILKKLKIIEEDIKADELCTRREFARWLVRANSLLERNPKHSILKPSAVSGSIIAAFDDIHVEDPDFEAIQSLAEAGIVRSRLIIRNYGSHLDSTDTTGIFFYPERFLSRQDLIDWKAQLEYEASLGLNEKISEVNLGFMDKQKISQDVSPEFFVDMLAGDRSILRRVFGQGKRFQPNKPSTKAQAAVALTSCRMAEAITAELTRLDAENILRKREMEVIKMELLEKGDIRRFWDKKLEEEKTRASEVESVYFEVMHNLEQENISQEKSLAEYTKQMAAMDCQTQLLWSLKEEVNEMSKRLTVEKIEYVDEQHTLKDMLGDSEYKLEKAHDAKSVLEAEIESLRILRSWITDEAMKSQTRVKVLEEVGRRWKWEDRA